jgi:hypothetical protein
LTESIHGRPAARADDEGPFGPVEGIALDLMVNEEPPIEEEDVR